MEAVWASLSNIKETYGEEAIGVMSQGDFMEELLISLWSKGYKVVPLEQEDYHDH
jgi:hypothetical protein